MECYDKDRFNDREYFPVLALCSQLLTRVNAPDFTLLTYEVVSPG